MAPQAVVEHQLPGRARLRIPSKRGDVQWFGEVVQWLSRNPDVYELSANPKTASLLIEHEALTSLSDLLSGEPRLVEVTPASGSGSQARMRTQRGLLGSPEILDAASAGVTGLCAYQLSRGQVLGTALEHFWSAYGSHRTLQSPALVAGYAGLGLYQLTRGRIVGPAASLFYYATALRRAARRAARQQAPGAPT